MPVQTATRGREATFPVREISRRPGEIHAMPSRDLRVVAHGWLEEFAVRRVDESGRSLAGWLSTEDSDDEQLSRNTHRAALSHLE